MQTIHIKIEFLGVIAEQLSEDLNMQCLANCCIADVMSYLKRAYPHAYAALDGCVCTIDSHIVMPQTVLKQDTHIVLNSRDQAGSNDYFLVDHQIHSTESFTCCSAHYSSDLYHRINSDSIIYQWPM